MKILCALSRKILLCWLELFMTKKLDACNRVAEMIGESPRQRDKSGAHNIDCDWGIWGHAPRKF